MTQPIWKTVTKTKTKGGAAVRKERWSVALKSGKVVRGLLTKQDAINKLKEEQYALS